MAAHPLARLGANAILGAFEVYRLEFKSLTRRAKGRFEKREWHAGQRDAQERLDLYAQVMRHVVASLRDRLGPEVESKTLWAQIKSLYAGWIAGRPDVELAETFFNSATRRIFATVGVDPNIEFVSSDFELPLSESGPPIYTAYPLRTNTADLLRAVLNDYAFQIPYQDFERDIRLGAAEIDEHLRQSGGAPLEAMEIARPVFYRGKGAYLVGRLRRAGERTPIALAIRHPATGLRLDAALLTEDEVSILFSFTRSYFHVDVDRPHELIVFLRSILPHKPVAELYISIGYNKHGKTELYRDLLRHLQTTDDQFQPAPGDKGMVMAVFTLPSLEVVFKIIRDKFDYPKTATRQEVMEKYQLVFKHDRAGRLVDAQEFEHLSFDRARFAPALLDEFRAVAGDSVRVTGDRVVIRHLYTERRMTPLNLYLRQATGAEAREAVLDYGQAVKDLAATNTFPGDMLLKNFGVTRHGRVIFYDYDELCRVTDCRFRDLPRASGDDEEFSAEPWFYVGPNDIFPEEFIRFLGFPDHLRKVFLDAHSDLLRADFWRELQARLNAGEIVDIYPYRHGRRLARHDHTG